VIGFLAGTAVSVIGNVMAGLALPWFVLQTTGSASQTGFAAVAGALPAVMSGVFGGPLVDRFGGKRMSIIADLISALSVLAIPVLYHADLLNIPLLLALIFIGAILDIPGITARRMLLPGFQRRAGLRSEQMNSIFELIGNGAFMVGPVLAGFLIGVMGAVNLLWITAAGFAVSAVAVLFAAEDVSVAADAPRPGYLESVREGFRFISSTPILLALAALFSVSNFIANGFFAVGLPVFVNETWGTASRLGILFTMLGMGTLAGASLYGLMGHRLRTRRRAIILWGFMSQPLWLAAFVVTSSLPVLMVAMFLIGLSSGPANPLSVTVRFEHIPAALQGRVFATFSAIAGTIAPVGIAISGWIFDHFSVTTGMAIITIAYAMAFVATPFLGSLKVMNRPGPYADEPVPAD
jgi:MFS family permease